MAVELNAFEVFEVAEKIERNGARFYRRAAALFDGFNIRSLFQELAGWEIQHEQVFAKMRQQLSQSGREIRPVTSQSKLFPNAEVMAGLAVFGIKKDPSDEFFGKQDIVDIIRKAIEKEKDSIIYYTGLVDFVTDEVSKKVIDDIIKEEMRHIRILKQSLEQRQKHQEKFNS